MPRWSYLAVDPAGRERRGNVEAASDRAARESLAGRRWHVLRIEPYTGTAPGVASGSQNASHNASRAPGWPIDRKSVV